MKTCQCCGKRVISGVTVWTGTELVYRHYLCQNRRAQPATTQPATNEQTWINQEIGPRVVGGTYYNGYWGDTYTVEQIYRAPDASRWSMRVRWNDGHTSVHCTAWGSTRDNVVAPATVPERAPAGMLAVRVGSDPWTMVPLDTTTNPVGWDVIDTSTERASEMQTCHHEPEVHPDVYQFTGTEPGELLPAYADGGYPLYYLDTEGNTLCAPCATDASSYSACTSAAGVYYEGAPMTCDNCNAVIESAYGDPSNDN